MERTGSSALKATFLSLVVVALCACKEADDGITRTPNLNAPSGGGTPTAGSGAGKNNSPPRILGTPNFQAAVGAEYSFTPQATDADGDRLGFAVANLPRWAKFDSETGRLSGGPSTADVGSTKSIIISVSDGKSGASLPAFSILVTEDGGSMSGSAPRLRGTPPATAAVNELYAFEPTATDEDSSLLHFGIVNQPDWLEFDAGNGSLSGTPTMSDIGLYSGVVITVSDGVNTGSLGPFSINVTGLGKHSVTLTWTSPSENDDGTVLTDLAGFEIRYGHEPNDYQYFIDIRGSGTTTYRIEGLEAGDYYFATTAYNELGIASPLSNEVSAILN
jgi:hypothetical protein